MITLDQQDYHTSSVFTINDKRVVLLSASDIIEFRCKTHRHLSYKMTTEPAPATDAMNRGALLHALLLKPQSWQDQIAVIDDYSFRTANAKAQRALAIEQRKIPVLRDDLIEKQLMVEKLREQNPKIIERIETGKSESGIVWEYDGLWFKALHDSISFDSLTAIDYKTTKPDYECGLNLWADRRLNTESGLLRAGHYLASMQNADAELTYIVQEASAPYLSITVEISANSDLGTRALNEWRSGVADLKKQLKSVKSPILNGELPPSREGNSYGQVYL